MFASQEEETNPIAASLRHRNIDLVCYMTPRDRLPLIFEHGGLLSYMNRQEQGIPERANAHFWGSANKKDDFGRYIVCGFMAPWWMCKKHDEELTLILLDAQAVCTKPRVCFCPGNSAYSAFPAGEVLASIGPTAFEGCFPNPDTYQAKSAEIFVPGGVPLIDFRGVVFCDAVAVRIGGRNSLPVTAGRP